MAVYKVGRDRSSVCLLILPVAGSEQESRELSKFPFLCRSPVKKELTQVVLSVGVATGWATAQTTQASFVRTQLTQDQHA